MDETPRPFEVELHLANGSVITYQVPEDRVREIQSRGWDWPADMPEDAKPFAGVFNDLFHRLRKGTGFVQASDRDGRSWMVRADSIMAFNVMDFREPTPARPIGYQPPMLEASGRGD